MARLYRWSSASYYLLRDTEFLFLKDIRVAFRGINDGSCDTNHGKGSMFMNLK
jgi:hypothetical protein